MRRIFILFFLLFTQLLNGQTYCDINLYLDFGDTTCMSQLTIDTVDYPHNTWQIGHYQKTIIDSTSCNSKVIITDTVNPYPINDTSVFIIRVLATDGVVYGCKDFQGSYYVQTDTLNDYGKIELSPDNGVNWIDIINDTSYSSIFTWYDKPVLSGHSRVCKYFEVWCCDLGSAFNI